MDNPRHGGDTALEGIVLGGFMLLAFFLLFQTVPDANGQHFSQINGALIVIATLIAKSLWERRGSSGTVSDIATTAVDKLPPASVPEKPAPPSVPAARSAVPGVVDVSHQARSVDETEILE